MLKCSLKRWIFKNRGALFNTFCDTSIARRNDMGKRMPKITSVLNKAFQDSNRNIISIRKMSNISRIRQNYHEESEDGVNKQINLELYASNVYLAMAYHFDRDDVALPEVSAYFKRMSHEEHDHAEKLMKFQNLRGGLVLLDDSKAPDKNKWENVLEAMEDALALEKKVNQSLLDLHKIASKHEDAQMTDFLEKEYLNEQVKDIKELGDHVTNLQRVGPGLGEYLFDKYLK